MPDLSKIKNDFAEFLKERDWEQFHNPKDLAIALAIEVGEFLEYFRFKRIEEIPEIMEMHRDEIELELGDIFHFVVALSKATDIDLSEAFYKKLELNKKKYPKEKVKGKSHKYTYYLE